MFLGLGMNSHFPRICRAVLFLFVPLLILLLVRNDLNQAGTLDPFIYAAFSYDYIDIAARYPGTYYATRLAHILPNALAIGAVGDHAGYTAVRYLQLVAGTIATYVVARHYASEAVAGLLAIFFSSHVWLLRSLLWDYVDGSVVIYAMVGIALLMPRKNEIWAHFGAGAAFSLAANANPMGLVIAGAYSVTWFIERANRPTVSKLKSILSCAAGFTVGYSALILSMVAINPDAGWSFDRVTFNMISWLFAGGARNWFASFQVIFANLGFYQPLILPFFVLIAIVSVFHSDGSEERRKALGALSFITIITGVFLVLHYVFAAGAFRVFFFLIYAFPAGVVSLSALLGQWRPRKTRSVIVAGTIFLVAQFAFWSHSDALPSELSRHHAEIVIPAAAVAFAGVIFLGIAQRIPSSRGNSAMFAGSIFLFLLASNAIFVREDTARIYSSPSSRETEWDVRNGARYLQRFVAEYVPRQEAVRFWYGNRDKYLNSVQSAHLWLFSRLSGPAKTDAQMPMIDAAIRDRMKSARYLAVLGTKEEVDGALDAIKAEGLDLKIVSRGEFRGRAWQGYLIALGVLR